MSLLTTQYFVQTKGGVLRVSKNLPSWTHPLSSNSCMETFSGFRDSIFQQNNRFEKLFTITRVPLHRDTRKQHKRHETKENKNKRGCELQYTHKQTRFFDILEQFQKIFFQESQ